MRRRRGCPHLLMTSRQIVGWAHLCVTCRRKFEGKVTVLKEERKLIYQLLLKTFKIWKMVSRFSLTIKNAKTVLLCDNTDLIKAQVIL